MEKTMRDERWDEVIHCIKVKRFPEVANLLLKIREAKPAGKDVKKVAAQLKREWERVHQLRRPLGTELREIAEEVVDNIEDWLDFLPSNSLKGIETDDSR